jgi:hypothetical protein
VTAPDPFRSWLIRVLEVLTWEADRQLAYIDRIGVGVDELALQFDDAFHLAESKVRDGLLSGEMFHLLELLDERFEEMTSGPGCLWSTEGLSEAPEWKDVRSLASRALSGLGGVEVCGDC